MRTIDPEAGSPGRQVASMFELMDLGFDNFLGPADRPSFLKGGGSVTAQLYLSREVLQFTVELRVTCSQAHRRKAPTIWQHEMLEMCHKTSPIDSCSLLFSFLFFSPV